MSITPTSLINDWEFFIITKDVVIVRFTRNCLLLLSVAYNKTGKQFGREGETSTL